MKKIQAKDCFNQKIEIEEDDIYMILRESIPNELADYFNIEANNKEEEEKIYNFIEDIIIDIRDNLG